MSKQLAFLVVFGLAACAPRAAPTTPAPAPAEGAAAVAYTAQGNEPFWRLDADGAGAMWRTPEREIASDGPPTPAPTPTVPGWRGFSANFGGQRLMAEVTYGPCQDSMSGMFYPDRVAVTFAGQSFTGCGGAPMALLTGDWRAMIGADEIGTVSIAEDGGLSASAGCNRMAGRVALTGEGLAIGPLAATRMACAEPLMTREQRLAGALEAARSFSVEADGTVLLEGAGGQRLRLTRP